MIMAMVSFTEMPGGKVAVFMTSGSEDRTELERRTAAVYDKAFDAAFRAITKYAELKESSYASGNTIDECIAAALGNAFGGNAQ